VRRWIWVAVAAVLVLVFGASYVLLQLTILQPPVLEANILERRLARAYRETATIQPITALPVTQVGDGALFHKASSASRPVLLLPDLGGGAWVFEKFLSAWRDVDAYALSYRGGLGGNPVNNATLEEYVSDARTALERVRTSSGRKPVLVGQGMGALIAMRLARDVPQELDGLVLIAPYVPRDWSDQQLWLARTIGNWAYGAAYSGGQAARDFWVANFPSGFMQSQLAVEALNKYALERIPFEYKGVIQDVNFTKLEWLDAAYASLEQAKFNVLHIAARYDTTNPMGAQRELRTRLEADLGARYRIVILNSNKYVSLDWKWQRAADAVRAFVRDGQIKENIIENQAVLDPTTDPPPDR
jgi:pimeloyl-ACP methyl ester carboxylesterase